MMTSALLKRGISYLDTIATELLIWMGEHEYDSIQQMQGSMSRNAVPQPARLRTRQLHEGAELATRCAKNYKRAQRTRITPRRILVTALIAFSRISLNPLLHPELIRQRRKLLFSEGFFASAFGA